MPPVQSKMEKKCDVHVKEHVGTLSFNLNSARKEERLCDFIIKVGSRGFHVHKIVLSEGSDYFRGMFTHKMRETECALAEMQDVDPDCMCICIEYIYTGKVSVPQSKVFHLLKAAHLFQLAGLYNALVSFLQKNLDAESYFAAKDLANKFGLTQLEEKCDQYARDEFEKVSQQDEFKSVDMERLLSLISDKGNKAPEEVKLNSIFRWIEFKPQARQKFLQVVHKHVDFSKASVDYRRKLIEDEPLVYSCSELMQHISLSVIDTLSASPDRLTSANAEKIVGVDPQNTASSCSTAGDLGASDSGTRMVPR